MSEYNPRSVADPAGESEREREELAEYGRAKLRELKAKGVILKAGDMMRGGKQLLADEAAALCRQVAPQLLAETMVTALDRENSPSERLAATKLLLERGYGRPSQQVSIEGTVDVTHLHLEAVRELAGRAKGQVIDLVTSYEAEDVEKSVQEVSHSHQISDDASVQDVQHAPHTPDDATRHAEPAARYSDTAPNPAPAPEPAPRRRVKRRN